jgi:hypothetical protein
MQFPFNMHDHSFVSIRCSLQSTAYIAYLHRIFINPCLLCKQGIAQCFELSLLNFEFVNLLHDSLRLINLSLFTQLLSLLDEEIDLLLQLINPLMGLLLLESIHLWGVHA